MAISDALKDFSSWSGLQINHSKSAIYFGGTSEETIRVIAAASGLGPASLPFKYLGIPLDGKSLRSHAYKEIIERMTDRITSWSCKLLYYAGRLVLLNHVLSYICSYWMRIFIFPKSVLKTISSICRNFLWSGRSEGSHNIVAWKTVCTGKVFGGLGCIDLNLFNKSLVLSQTWDIILEKPNPWVKWINAYYLRNTSYWNFNIRPHHHWTLKKVINLRPCALKLVDFHTDGSVVWKAGDGGFTVKDSYMCLRNDLPKKQWSQLVWNRVSSPKHMFCAWLACNNRLPTLDKLKGVQIDRMCIWCHRELETNNELIFDCEEMQILKNMTIKVGCNIILKDWEDLLAWIDSNHWSSNQEKEASYFLIVAAVYNTWKNRNDKVHRNRYQNDDIVVDDIIRAWRLKEHSLKDKESWRNYCSNL